MQDTSNAASAHSRGVGTRITDEAIESLRAKLGQVLTSSHTPWPSRM
jgi:hypothetical protein